jgi:periplasmic protein TonB
LEVSYGNFFFLHLNRKLHTMTSKDLLKADLLDILFEGRNKQYGAYALRRQYNGRLGLALGIALALCLLVFLLKPSLKEVSDAWKEKPDLVMTTFELPQVPLPPTPPPPPPAGRVTPPPATATASLTDVLKFVDEVDPAKAFDDLSNMKDVAIGNTNTEGPVVTNLMQPATPDPVSGSGTSKPEAAEEKFMPIEQQPEFPGGMQAWVAFLRHHLQTPDDLAEGEKKMVLVSFVVDKDGTVTGFRVVQSGGRSFDEEVMRVLRKMPKWKPAIQNGNPVALTYTQPVTFVGVEQ